MQEADKFLSDTLRWELERESIQHESILLIAPPSAIQLLQQIKTITLQPLRFTCLSLLHSKEYFKTASVIKGLEGGRPDLS
jgi:hypothetical protein